MSPHPSLYQHTLTGSVYNRSSSSSAHSVRSDDPLGRQKKKVQEGPQAGVTDKKGKKKAISQTSSPSPSYALGKNPLEIAYGPTLGTHPEITTDDFNVDAEQGLHRPQDPGANHWKTALPVHDGPSEEGFQVWGQEIENETSRQTSPHFVVDEEENVWGR